MEGIDPLNMNLSFRSRLIVFVALLSLASALEVRSETFVNIPLRKDLVGSWSGVSDNTNVYLKLELNDDGAGRIAYTALSHNVGRVFVTPIAAWSFKDGKVTCILRQSPFEKGPETLAIEWDGGACLRVVLKGSDWSTEARLCADKWLTMSEETVTRALKEKSEK